MRGPRTQCAMCGVGLLFVFSLLPTGTAWASDASGHGHADPIAPVVLAIGIILVAAKLAGDLATRLGQAAVLGELLVGVFLGNEAVFGAIAGPVEGRAGRGEGNKAEAARILGIQRRLLGIQ